MIKTFIIKKTVKIVKKELDKRGGAVKVTKDVAGIVKSEVNKYDIPNKISGLTSKLKKKIMPFFSVVKHTNGEYG